MTDTSQIRLEHVLLCFTPLQLSLLTREPSDPPLGVYKGQGRNQRELMTRTYWEFLVQGTHLQVPFPITKDFHHWVT
jgi:hypothetical protein